MLAYKILKDNGFLATVFDLVKAVDEGLSVKPIVNTFDEEKAFYKILFKEDLDDHITVTQMNNDYKTRIIVVDEHSPNTIEYVTSLRHNMMNGKVVKWNTIFVSDDMLTDTSILFNTICLLIKWYWKIGLFLDTEYRDINDVSKFNIAESFETINADLEYLYCAVRITDELANLKYNDKKFISSMMLYHTEMPEYALDCMNRMYDHIIETPDIEDDNYKFYCDIAAEIIDKRIDEGVRYAES